MNTRAACAWHMYIASGMTVVPGNARLWLRAERLVRADTNCEYPRGLKPGCSTTGSTPVDRWLPVLMAAARSICDALSAGRFRKPSQCNSQTAAHQREKSAFGASRQSLARIVPGFGVPWLYLHAMLFHLK